MFLAKILRLRLIRQRSFNLLFFKIIFRVCQSLWANQLNFSFPTPSSFSTLPFASSFLFAVGGHVFGLACFWPSAIGPSVNRLANSADKQAAVHAGAIGALVGEEAALYPLWATF